MHEGMIVSKCGCGKARAYAMVPKWEVKSADGKASMEPMVADRKTPRRVIKETYTCRKCRKHARHPRKVKA